MCNSRPLCITIHYSLFHIITLDNILCCSSLLIFPAQEFFLMALLFPLESLWSTHSSRPEAGEWPKHNAIIVSTVNVPQVVLALHTHLWLTHSAV